MLARRLVGRFAAASRSRGPHSLSQYAARSLASLSQGPSANDIFANGTNAYYADEMYRLWKQDPQSVHPSWNVYFSGLERGLTSSEAFKPPPMLTTHLPYPSDGSPALHVTQGAELDDHLKVRYISINFITLYNRLMYCIRYNFSSVHTRFGVIMLQNWTLWAYWMQIWLMSNLQSWSSVVMVLPSVTSIKI